MSSEVSQAPDGQALQKEFQAIGEEIQKLATTRQTLSIQLNENEGVREEFALLGPGAVVYREIGPTLVQTDRADAKALVDGRVDLISKDLKKIEAMVEEKGKRRLEIQQIVQKLMEAEQAANAAAQKKGKAPALKV
jgi:prefoldin beta subunit